MKKLLYSLAAAGLALGACNEFDDEVSKAYPDGPSISVDVKVLSDSAITYTVTPASGSLVYTYAIVEDDDAKTEYTADDIAGLIAPKSDFGPGVGRSVMTADAASVKGEVDKLTPFGKYVFIAVAYNEYDKAGAVTAEKFQLNDNVAPDIKVVTTSGDSALVVIFTEAVKVDNAGQSEGKCTAFSAVLFSSESRDVVNSHVTSIKVSGDSVYFNIDGATNGMYASIGWEGENAITDLKGNAFGPLETGFDPDENVFAQFDFSSPKLNVESISAEGVSGKYADIDNFVLTVKTKEAIYEGSEDSKGYLTATFSASDDNMSSTIKTSVTIVDEHTFTVAIPAVVLPGQKISAILEDGALVDANGNKFAGDTLISEKKPYTTAVAMQLSDVIGTYDAQYYLYTDRTAHNETWKIESTGESEGYEYGVKISGIGVATSTKTAEGRFNALTHILYIDTEVGTTSLTTDDGETVEMPVYIIDYDDTDESAMLSFSAPGAAKATNYFIVYADDDKYGGTKDYMMETSIKRQ